METIMHNHWLISLTIIAALGAIGAIAVVKSLDVGGRLRKTHRPDLRIELIVGDITVQHVDAIVNAAKSSLMGGGGVDGAIHRAGGPAIHDACLDLRRTHFEHGLPEGRAVVTTAGDLPARFVIHTVGPVYDPLNVRRSVLRDCYINSLAAADAVGARTVAFPLISSGVYGWPVKDAVGQAIIAMIAARTSVEEVRLVLFDEATYRTAVEVAASVKATADSL